MAKLEIAIDLGTCYTTLFVSGYGIILREPSVIAYGSDGKSGKMRVVAVGDEAYAMIGKASERTKIVTPVIDGTIADPKACADMLGEFMKKILPESYIVKPRVRAIASVPMGITVDERKTYEEVLLRSGADDIIMINSVMLAAVGVGLPVNSTCGGMIVSIGGGVTEIAVAGLFGITTGSSINIGGNMIDRTLSDSISGVYNLRTDLATVRKIKDGICSLVRNDCAKMSVSGRDLETKNIRTLEVSADSLYSAVYIYYINIIDAIKSALYSCSPALAAEVQKHGITVVGGGARIPGLETLMKNTLDLRINIPSDPQYAAIVGAGMLLSDKYLLEEVVKHS